MSDSNVAKAYARSLVELDTNSGDELTKFNELINSSNELENLLFLSMFTREEKKSVLDELFKKLKPPSLISNFIYFLLQEDRLGLLPQIWKELVVLEDHKKGFMKGTIEGPDPKIDEAVKAKLASFMKEKMGKEIKLDYRANESVSAGYRITVEDLQLDASLDRQLDRFKQEITQE